MRNYVPIQAPTLENRFADANYRYQEYVPSRYLTPYVACYWSLEFAGSDHINPLHRILPDGCVDVIFNLKSPAASTCAFVAGLMTGHEASILSDDQSLFGVRFFSETVRPFIQYPVSEFRNFHVLFNEIWGSEVDQLNEEMMLTQDASQRIDRIETFLLKVMTRNAAGSEPLLQHGMQYLYRAKGKMTIRDLAEQLNYSERNIRRTFQKELGIRPKEMSDIIRFQSLLQEMYRSGPKRYSDIAAKYGYSDQPHLINSFKRLYGASPTQIFKRTL